MKPSDVTDAMAEEMRKMFCVAWNNKDTIAASFNIIANDAEPITAEWLLANGWYCACPLSKSYRHKQMDSLFAWFCDGQLADVAIGDVSLPTKTIGQLRALHAGLGIGEVQ